MGGWLAGPGAAAGALAAFAFATVHALLISDIWRSLVAMLAAGAICGATIAWSYGRLFQPSIRSWLGYNASFVVALGALGVMSVAIFEPRMTMAALLTVHGPPSDLILAASPLTILVTLGAAVVMSLLFGRTWAASATILATCSVLVALLGLNVSVIGLVQIPTSSLYLVAELFGLIIVLAASFSAVFVSLLWRRWPRRA